MGTYTCFWGLLSSEDFSIVYISQNIRSLEESLGVKFIGSPIFGIISPTEVPRLRKDLNVFRSSTSFNGVGIRCSVYDFGDKLYGSNINLNHHGPKALAALNLPYATYSLSMQSITSNLVLAMFHIDEDFLHKNGRSFNINCFHNYDQNEINFINQCLLSFDSTRDFFQTIDGIGKISISPTTASNGPEINPSRSLVIYDSCSPRILYAWPKSNFNRLCQSDTYSFPLNDLTKLFHPSDSEKFLKGMASYLHNNQYHKRVNYLAEAYNSSGNRIQQIMFCVGNIIVSCSQIELEDVDQYMQPQNSLTNSRSLSFSREYDINPRYEIPKKLSAPVLINDYNFSNSQKSNLVQNDSSGIHTPQEYEQNSLFRVRSSILPPITPCKETNPRKSVSTNSMSYSGPRLRGYSNSSSEKRTNKFFSFLPQINIGKLPRLGRNSFSKDNHTENIHENTTLPPISYMTQTISPPDSRMSEGTSLPSFSNLISPNPHDISITQHHSQAAYHYHTPASNAQNQTYPPNIAAKPSNGQTFPSPLLHSGRKCLSCHATSSPEWRRGPMGQKTLCNACGLKYSRQLKAMRNQSNPEFVAKLNSLK